MKQNVSTRFTLPTLALSSLLLTGVAQAGWGVSINLPIQTQTQYYNSSSTTVYGVPDSRIVSTRQVPQTVCRPTWIGSTTQQCSTQYITVEDDYVAPAPMYINPPLYAKPQVYIAPNPAFGYPSYEYGYNNNYQQQHRHRHGYQNYPQYRQPGPPPTTIYYNNGANYGIGGSVPTYGGYGNPNKGNVNIHLNSR